MSWRKLEAGMRQSAMRLIFPDIAALILATAAREMDQWPNR